MFSNEEVVREGFSKFFDSVCIPIGDYLVLRWLSFAERKREACKTRVFEAPPVEHLNPLPETCYDHIDVSLHAGSMVVCIEKLSEETLCAGEWNIDFHNLS